MGNEFRRPQLPRRLPGMTLEKLENGQDFSGVGITGCDLSGQTAGEILFEQAQLKRVLFTRTHLSRIRMLDVRAELCDWSGASWEKGRFRRVELKECRLSGFQLFETELDQVLFTDCIFESAVIVTGSFQGARFEGCNLREARFEESDLTGTVFSHCDLTGSSLAGCKLEGVDLRGSTLSNLRANAKDLRGILIEPSQAVQIVSLFGIKVEEVGSS